MGCCSSSLVDQDLLTSSTGNSNIAAYSDSHNNNNVQPPLLGVHYSKNKPFKRIGLMWTSDIPMTRLELESKRALYWNTASVYGGREEIWQALNVAFSEIDIVMARSILEAANVALPTGNPCEGCYDELGYSYEIPLYCVVPPSNLIQDDSEHSFETSSITIDYSSLCATQKENLAPNQKSFYSSTQSDSLVPAPDCTQDPFSIVVRLSTDKDVKLNISSEKETVGSLKSRIFYSPESSISPDAHILRLIYLGRILRDDLAIACEEGEIEPEEIFATKHSVRIEKNSIVQGLVATKKF